MTEMATQARHALAPEGVRRAQIARAAVDARHGGFPHAPPQTGVYVRVPPQTVTNEPTPTVSPIAAPNFSNEPPAPADQPSSPLVSPSSTLSETTPDPSPAEGSSSFGASTSTSPATPSGFTSLEDDVFAPPEPPQVYWAYDPSALDEQLAAGEQHSEFESGGDCASPAGPAGRA